MHFSPGAALAGGIPHVRSHDQQPFKAIVPFKATVLAAAQLLRRAADWHGLGPLHQACRPLARGGAGAAVHIYAHRGGHALSPVGWPRCSRGLLHGAGLVHFKCTVIAVESLI